MKIAFTGAGGTGKTTLAKHLSEKWGVPYVGSVSREVMAEQGISSEAEQASMTDEQLLVLQHAVPLDLEQLAAIATDADVGVVDAAQYDSGECE